LRFGLVADLAALVEPAVAGSLEGISFLVK
jgi:hypothetical protein